MRILSCNLQRHESFHVILSSYMDLYVNEIDLHSILEKQVILKYIYMLTLNPFTSGERKLISSLTYK